MYISTQHLVLHSPYRSSKLKSNSEEARTRSAGGNVDASGKQIVQFRWRPAVYRRPTYRGRQLNRNFIFHSNIVTINRRNSWDSEISRLIWSAINTMGARAPRQGPTRRASVLCLKILRIIANCNFVKRSSLSWKTVERCRATRLENRAPLPRLLAKIPKTQRGRFNERIFPRLPEFS